MFLRFFTMVVTQFLVCIISLVMIIHQAWAESFWDSVLRITGISSNPSTQKGPSDEIEAGDIWVVNLVHKTRQRLTKDGGYRSPIFVPGDQHILALNGNTLIQVPFPGEEPEKLYTIKGIVKIVGFHKEDQDKILILIEDNDGRLLIGLFSLKSGQVTSIIYDAASKEDRRMLIHLKGWERVYGNTKVYVKSETKDSISGLLEWTDVYIKQGKDAINISKCDGVKCGQPSLSNDGRQVVFVKEGP